MSCVVISKSPSLVVQPSEPVTTGTGDIKLSSYDMVFGAVPITTFYVFEHPIQEPVETMKRSLSQALVHYYPIAGRLAAGAAPGEAVIRCTGEGVHFVAASANCAIKDVQLWDDASLKDELAIYYETLEGYSYTGPLVVMQVTVFSCGGFVVGLTWNHAIGDGRGGAQFLQAVGELARGLPTPSVVPVRSEDALESGLGLPPSSTSIFRVMGSFPPSPMASLDITVPSTLVNRIKAKYSSSTAADHGRPCTVFEAVAAVLWRCRTRAIMSEPESLAVLCYPADARRYAGAKDGYYGNCVSLEVVTATSDAVANGDVMDLVKMIRLAKGRVPDQSDMEKLRAYNFLFMTCWRNLGLDAPDFGAGRPARVMTHWKGENFVPLCTTCIPCKDEHSVLSMFVREEHAGAFLRELAHINNTLYA